VECISLVPAEVVCEYVPLGLIAFLKHERFKIERFLFGDTFLWVAS
jgi:hypothetical protein